MKIKVLSLLIMIAAVICGCSSDDGPAAPTPVSIDASLSAIEAPAEGGTYSLHIAVHQPATEWHSILPSDGWVTMTPCEGIETNGKLQRQIDVTVTVAPNTFNKPRRADVRLYTPIDSTTITITQNAIARNGCAELSVKEISYTENHYEYRPVTVTTYEDVDISVPSDSWLQTAEMPTGTVKANSKVTFYVAPDGPTAAQRTATVTLTGKDSGETSTVTVKQNPLPITDGYPARWHYTNEEANSSGWLTHGCAFANYDAGATKAVITAVGVNNRRLGHLITTSYRESTGVSNLYTGDYLLFSFPARKLPAGTAIDFMMAISSDNNTAPKYWITEILDGGQWVKPDAADLHQIDGEDYSFYTRYFSSYQHCTFLQSFILKNPVTDGLVQVRCRVVGNRNGNNSTLSPINTGAVYLPSHEFHMCSMAAYPGIERKGVKKVAILGNSFTHYFGSAYLLKEIARSQGYQLDLRAFAKGSQYFRNHLTLERSADVIAEPGYDYVILQEQSTQHSTYVENHDQSIIDEMAALTLKFRANSPDARIILENTWAFPSKNWNGYGSSSKFEELLLSGAKAVAQADPNTDWISPIGVAFDAAYAAGITDLWYTDSKHPSRNGTYLKSCVNYLVLFGEPFGTGVSDGGCDPATAARLRAIAEQTVLGHEADYFIVRP